MKGCRAKVLAALGPHFPRVEVVGREHLGVNGPALSLDLAQPTGGDEAREPAEIGAEKRDGYGPREFKDVACANQ